MSKTFILFVFLSYFLFSCGSESSEKKETDKVQTENDSTVANDVNEKSTEDDALFLKMAKETDNWISKINKEDTVRSIVTYTDDYDESTDIFIYSNSEGEFHHANLISFEDENSLFSITYYFDREGKICRMDETEIRKGYWQDETNKFIYMSDGNPYWIHQNHIYKGEMRFDSSYIGTPFTEDTYPVFYETNHIKNLMTKK